VANVLIGKVEVALEDVAHWLSGVSQVVLKGPAIVTALASLLSALDQTVLNTATDISQPTTLLQISVQTQLITDLKSVWTDIKAVFSAAGFKI
jgi:hypothetical protein